MIRAKVPSRVLFIGVVKVVQLVLDVLVSISHLLMVLELDDGL